VYVALAIGVIQWEIRHTGGGWINLRDLGTKLVTAPSQLVFSPLLKAMGLEPISVHRPRPAWRWAIGVWDGLGSRAFSSL
jgi:hypothetical protein